MINHRIAALAFAAAGFATAHADITYNVQTAKITFNDGTSSDLNWTTSGAGNSKLDFTPGTYPWLVGDGATPRTAATIDVIYTATSTVPVGSVNLVFSGQAYRNATVGYSEFIESADGSSALGSIAGVQGGADLGGSNDPFNVAKTINFASAVTEYKVKKTFVLADLDSDPKKSFASIGFIEQNAQPVPEPASMAALGFGVLGLLRRRRKKA